MHRLTRFCIGHLLTIDHNVRNPFVESVSDIVEDSNISPLLKDVEGDKPSENY